MIKSHTIYNIYYLYFFPNKIFLYAIPKPIKLVKWLILNIILHVSVIYGSIKINLLSLF